MNGTLKKLKMSIIELCASFRLSNSVFPMYLAEGIPLPPSLAPTPLLSREFFEYFKAIDHVDLRSEDSL